MQSLPDIFVKDEFPPDHDAPQAPQPGEQVTKTESQAREEVNSEHQRQVDLLQGLGFKEEKNDVSHVYSLKLDSRDDLIAFMRKKAYLQTAGTQTTVRNGVYERWRCTHHNNLEHKCPFVLLSFQTADGIKVQTPEIFEDKKGFFHHRVTCPRPRLGQHGLLPAEKKIAIESRTPNSAVLATAIPVPQIGTTQVKQEDDHDIKEERSTQNLEGISKEKIRRCRRYNRDILKGHFMTNPTAFIAEKFPDCEVKLYSHNECHVVTVFHKGLLNYLLKGDDDNVFTDATYFIAPPNGNVITLGVEVHGSFIPIFCCISAPLNPTEKNRAPEHEEHLTFVFSKFKEVVHALPHWLPIRIVRDHATQYLSAFRNVFGPTVLDAVCYFHVAQANEKHIRTNVSDEETAKAMHDLMRTFRAASPSQFEVGWGLAVKELGEQLPVWGRFLELQRAAGRAPGGVNASWVGPYQDNNSIERWHERLKKEVQSEGQVSGHLSLLKCTELLCRLLTEAHKLLNTYSPDYCLPLYFESRELHLRSVRSEALRSSTPYQAALERTKNQGSTAMMTSHGGIRVLQSKELSEMESDAHYSLDRWIDLVKVYKVSGDHCTCPHFRTYQVCKHQLAMSSFIEKNLNAPLDISPAHRGRPVLADISNTPQQCVQNNSKDGEPKWRSPNTIFHHPIERPMNSWQKRNS